MDLKDYRKKEIPMLLLGNILVLLYFLKIFDVTQISKDNMEWINLIFTILNSTILSSVLYIFTIVLDGIFSDKIKYKLLYLFFGKMPGEVVFSDFLINNIHFRFSYEDLYKNHPEIYDNMPSEIKAQRKYENKEWYKLLKKHQSEDMVFQSHRDSLMLRDMYCNNILVLIMYLVLSVGFGVLKFSLHYIIFVILLTVLLNIAARNKGKRFVYNVIASDMSGSGD